jgi:hypothetical protein
LTKNLLYLDCYNSVKIKSAKTEDIVGTYTAKYNGKEFTGNLILR